MIMHIPITKTKPWAAKSVPETVEIDTDSNTLPDNVYQEALFQGLKVLLNRGTSKITKEGFASEAEMISAAKSKAQEQLALLMAGKVRASRAAKPGTSREVTIEATRLAVAEIKAAMREAGLKISHYKSKDITACAKDYLKDHPELIQKAEAAIAARDEKVKTGLGVDLKTVLHEDATQIEKVAKAAAKSKAAKAAAKADKPPLSAAVAGKVLHRPKPEARPN